jgi:hypothetical protein
MAMDKSAFWRSGFFALLFAIASASASAQERPSTPPSGRIKIQQIQVAFLASGAFGGGTLTYKGRSYPLKIAGLGVGGIGASRFTASGDVYGLDSLSDFEGPYGEVRAGWALGERGKGRMWLRNANGVSLNLKGTRQGLQTALGADGVVITIAK